MTHRDTVGDANARIDEIRVMADLDRRAEVYRVRGHEIPLCVAHEDVVSVRGQVMTVDRAGCLDLGEDQAAPTDHVHGVERSIAMLRLRNPEDGEVGAPAADQEMIVAEEGDTVRLHDGG